MKQCPVCHATYDDRVDFCFEDGALLETIADADDPTALPSPSKGIPLAAAVTEIKPRRPRRGMFGRPSVADMLDVAAPAPASKPPERPAPPPVGGVRVPAPAPLDELPTVVEEPAEAAVAPPPPEDNPAADLPGLMEQDTVLDEPEAASGVLPPAISVPPSPLAVDVPEAELPVEPTDAPPGLEVPEPAAALDDSWFGDETFEDAAVAEASLADAATFVDEEDTLPIPPSASAMAETDFGVEDNADPPGFDDAGLPGFDDDVGFGDDVGFTDDVGFADDDSWDDVSTTQSQPIPKGMVVGGVVVLAAAVLLTMVLSGGDEDPAPMAVQAVAEQPAPAPAPVPEPVEEPAPSDPAPEDAEVDGEAADGDAVAPGIDEGAPSGELSVDEPPPRASAPAPAVARSAPTAPKAAKAKAARPAQAAAPVKAAKGAKAGRSAPKKDPVSVWTGAPAASSAAPAPAPAAASNPWGAPAETPARGRLTISTDPTDAMVFVDGRRIGRSPTETEVTFGTHQVRVEKDDYKANSRVVNVQSAQVTVPFRLEPSMVSGKCNLLGTAGAMVSMDGKKVGSLPLTVACSPGSHTFVVTPADGAAFTTSRAVSFASAGETATIFLSP